MENLRGDLNQQPRNDRVRDGYLVNIAPLQLGEEVVSLHGFGSDFGAITFWIRLRGATGETSERLRIIEILPLLVRSLF